MSPAVSTHDVPAQEPIKPSGALNHIQYEDITPTIGREFFDVNIVDDILHNAKAEDCLRDLAYASEYAA